MAANRENNTMAEGCRKLVQQIADMKLEADADMPFLLDLENNIIQYLKAPTAQDQAQQPPGGAMGSAMGQVMGGGSQFGGGAGMPNPDELRRILQQ